MEDFRGIAEESFPSFLTNSLLGDSGLVGRVPLSSSLGSPVAVSTLARNGASAGNRYSDIQASYLVEGKFSVPSELSHSQSDAEANQRLQLSFCDDEKRNHAETQHLSDVVVQESALQSESARTEEVQTKSAKSLQGQDTSDGITAQEQVPDSAVALCLQSSWTNNKEHEIYVPDAAGTHFNEKTEDSHLNRTILLENEKLLSLTSFEDSSVDDDIDDEEFYDDHLEAYFEQLIIPGMLYEDLKGLETVENDFKLPASDHIQVNENSSLNCGSQSENNSSLPSLASQTVGNSEMSHKESQESPVVCVPGTGNSVLIGDSRRHVDGVLPFSSSTWRGDAEKGGAESRKGVALRHSREDTRHEIPVKTNRATDVKRSPICFHDTSAEKGDFDWCSPMKQGTESPHQNAHLTSDTEAFLHVDGCLHPESTKMSIKKTMNIMSSKPVDDDSIKFPGHLWSPATERRTCDTYKSIGKSKDQTDLPQSVVYQNEEGRWVTDLAYYTSFNKEQDLCISVRDEMNEDFISGSEARALIAQDEEEFNKEHQFMQEENIDAQNTSVALEDTSWGAAVNFSLLKKSLSPSDLEKDDASYLRLSLGEFFAQRSEALGCLGGGNNVKRPSFGYFITSPEKREPVALVRKSDALRCSLEKEMAHRNHNVLAGELNEQSQAQLGERSVTLKVNEMESTSQDDGSEMTLTADKTKTVEDIFLMDSHPRKCKDELSDSGDSVLRISTIASAIANASVNMDSCQLAAMIKTLSNKTREKTFQEDNKQENLAFVSHFLPNDLEKSNGSTAFDMEKYLKKTEVSRHEAGLKSFSSADVSDVWDLSFPKEQIAQAVHVVDLSVTTLNEVDSEENTATVYSQNTRRENQESSTPIDSSNPTVVDVKTCPGATKLPTVGNTEKTTSISTATSYGYSVVRNSRITSCRLLNDCKDIQNNTENQRQNKCISESSNSEKHVTFEKHPTVSPQNIDLKDTFLGHDGHCSEDDQDGSFRPSTSPLSHSSPSEVSGTVSSGSALECVSSTTHPQHYTSESVLSELVCSGAGVSKLTSLSDDTDNRYLISTTEYSHEGHQGNISSDMSTTIIRASPTPLEEHTVEDLTEKVPFQGKEKRTLPHVIPNNLDKKKVTEDAFLSSRAEDAKPNVRVCKDPPAKTGDLFETGLVALTSNTHEMCQTGMPPGPSRACLSCQALSPTADLPVSCPESVTRHQRMMSEDVLTANSASSGPTPHHSAPGSQCAPTPSLEGHGSARETRHLPAVIPKLLTGYSVTTTPFAQQCLETQSAAGDTAFPPPCHVGGPTVCGFSGGCPRPALPGEHLQSSVAVGVCLGQNFNSGLMGTTSLCNPYSNALNQNLLNGATPFPVPSVGTCYGTGPWDSGRMSELANVSVPEELKFPHACCVGIVSQSHLSVFNPSDRWLQVNIGVLSVSVNGEKVDLSTYPCLVFKSKVIIRPHTTEEIKVLFIPSSPGIFRCMFSVASWPLSADAETILQAEALASRVTLTAVAETPVIEVETEKKDVLDFGDLTYGGWKALPLKLINRTQATVPVRLVINAVSADVQEETVSKVHGFEIVDTANTILNAIMWRCFAFSREPVNTSLKAAPYANVIAQLAAPSVINHVMPASYDGQDPEFVIIWVLFHNPKKQMCSSEMVESAEEFLARIDIELDSPNPTPVIKSVSLRARTGVARIHAPKDLQTMYLFASVASSAKHPLPLKNAGNIEVYLDIKIPGQGSHFSVDPENLFLKPGEEREVMVSFTPEDSEASEKRIMKIFVQPFGPQYEVVLKGEVVSSENKTVTSGSCCSDIPSILSNKQFLAWGGVPLGRTQLQKLALRNNSTSTTQHLRLFIRGQDQDCFQLQNIFGSEERLTSNCEIRIRPKEDINIYVLFAPTRLSCMFAKLEIKQLGIRSQLGIKFTIPLSGYGGTSNIILEDVKKLFDSYMVSVNDLIPGKESRLVFSVRNTGSRAAFVKAVCFKDFQKKVLLDPKVMRIFPDTFVLKERTQQRVTIIYNPSDREGNCRTASELSTVYFFGGDEISRQQYRRALLCKPGIIQQILPEHSLLQNINFAETFQNELLVTEEYDLPQQPNVIQLFYGNMRKIILSVIGEFRDSVSNREFLQPSCKASLESKSESGTSRKHSSNVSLDVLPVKGPQGSPFLSQVLHPPQDKLASEEIWTVQPEHLILIAPSPCDMAKTKRFQILNNSVRSLKFELYWPAHCLTVTPQHGIIEPESKLQILVSPSSSLSTKHSLYPWSGLIYVHCDNGQKRIVKVQIQEDLTQEERPFTDWTSSLFQILPPGAQLSVSHLVKPVTQPPSTNIEIRNKTVTFPTTEPGETSENYLELENHGDTEVKWHLSSLAPPYVKISIRFLPRDRGNYAQFWDVECHPLKEHHMKHTLRFQLSGQSIKAGSEPESACISTNTLINVDHSLRSRRKAVSEASALMRGQIDLTHRGVYAPEDVYMFLPTRVGDSRTLKVNLRNNSFITHLLKFVSPREPFYIKHSKYSLRAQHYINMPVRFTPPSAGTFEALLVIQTDEGKSIAVRLIGEALEKVN